MSGFGNRFIVNRNKRRKKAGKASGLPVKMPFPLLLEML
jgi:hypothetical protein